jgi:Fe-S cluster assembly iron-binding protein IscA
MTNPNQLNTRSESTRQEMPVFSYPGNETILDNPDQRIEHKQSSQMTDLEDFETFVNSSSGELGKFKSQNDITSYIYEHFCENKQPDERMLIDSWFSEESLSEHNTAVNRLNGRKVEQHENRSWRGLQVGDVGLEKLGRIYLNPKNENYASTYRQIVGALAENGAQFQIKMLKHMNQHDYNRSDKMVLYFNPDQIDIVKNTVVDYVDKHPEKMNSNTPRFTERLTNSEGEILNGVSFAESPDMGKSFSTRMAVILTECYAKTVKNGSLDINSDEFFEAFSRSCIDHDVDARQPYKNANTSFPNE